MRPLVISCWVLRPLSLLLFPGGEGGCYWQLGFRDGDYQITTEKYKKLP